MNTTEYLKKAGIKGAHKLSEADRKRMCRIDLMAHDFEASLPYEPEGILGSRIVDRDATQLGIKIDWRG